MIDSAGYYYMGLDTVGICFLKKKRRLKSKSISPNECKMVFTAFCKIKSNKQKRIWASISKARAILSTSCQRERESDVNVLFWEWNS